MIKIVKDYIEHHKLLSKKDTVLIGVSGGPDSIALLHILHTLQKEYELKLHVAHLNHMFRGNEAKEDAEFVQSFCKKLQIPCTIAQEDVPAFLAKTGLSPEEGARHVRYNFFLRLVKEIGANKIALGHHADDQAETVLLNLFRGSGLRGLGGMRPKRDLFIRPLLGVTRAEIEQYIKDQKLPVRIDSTNLKPVYTRNHLRLKLLPLLKEKYNPNLVDSINRMAEIVQIENDYLEEITEELYRVHVEEDPYQLAIARKAFFKLPLALRRRLLRKMYKSLLGERAELSFKTVTMIEDFLEDKNINKNLGLPQEIVLKNKSELIILSKPFKFKSTVEFNELLDVPGKVILPKGCQLEAQVLLAPADWQSYKKAAGHEAYLDLDLVKLPLIVRFRKPGDSFYPLGLKHKKKVKDFFIDQKVPVYLRDSVPIVTGFDGNIVWLAGYRIDDRYKVSAATKRVLYLQFNEPRN